MKYLNMITSNCENNTIDIIKSSWDCFDKFAIVDGNLDWWENNNPYLNLLEEKYKEQDLHSHHSKLYENKEEWIIKINIEEVNKNESKLVVINRPWNDNYADAYMAHLNLLKEGDWVLIVDSDEYPGELLKQNLDLIIEKSNNGENYDIVMLPVVDWLEDEQLWKENEVPQEYINGMWTKHILLRKGKPPIQLRHFGSHVIPIGTKYMYFPFPYHHHRTLNSFIENEVFQMVLCPSGQMINPVEASLFQNAINRANITTFHEMKNAIYQGQLSAELETLAIKYQGKKRLDGSFHPFSQMYFAYFLLHGPKNGIKIPEDNRYTLQEVYEEIREWKIENKTYKNYIL